MKLHNVIGVGGGAIASFLVAAFAASTATATDLEDFYFRYDFSDGTKQFISSASQASDPCTDVEYYLYRPSFSIILR